MSEAVNRWSRQKHRQRRDRPAMPQRRGHDATVYSEKKASIWIALFRLTAGRRLKHQVTQQRRKCDRGDPAQCQRIKNDPEQRVAILARAVLRKTNRREG